MLGSDGFAGYGHGPHAPITGSRSSMFTVQLWHVERALAVGHEPQSAAGPRRPLTATGSATITVPATRKSEGHWPGGFVRTGALPGVGAVNAAPLPSHVAAMFSVVSS